MRKIILVLLTLMSVSCSGTLWDNRPRNVDGTVSKTGYITIKIEDPLIIFMHAQYLATDEGQAFLLSEDGKAWLLTDYGQEVYALYLAYYS